MIINTYQLILDTDTKHTCLQINESFEYDNDIFSSPEKVLDLMEKVYYLHQKADEYAYMLALNYQFKIMGVFEISHGVGNASLIDTRGIFIRALQIGAASIILVHNHPSGILVPSREDIELSKKIGRAGELMNIPLSDFIIIGCNAFASFKEMEIM